MDYHYISTDAELSAMLRACRDQPVLAVDTEFARFNTYYPMVGLLQIGIGTANYLVDPLTIEHLEGLRELMTHEGTLKVLHSGSEDMEVFQHWLGCVPTPVFDSQIAAAMVGAGYALSYQKLVAHYLEIDVPKGETRSDWLARPLRQSQCDYAALDVIHLFDIYPKLAAELKALGRYEWVITESKKLTEQLPTQTPHDEAYFKIKGYSSLNRRQLQLLKVVCAWREQEAQRQNVPRNRIVEGEAVLSLVLSQVDSVAALAQNTQLSRRAISRYGGVLVELVRQASAIPEAELPPKPVIDTTPVNKTKLDRLRQVLAQQAKLLNIAPELLGRRRDLESIIKSDNQGKAALPKHMIGWREAIIGKPLLEAIGK